MANQKKILTIVFVETTGIVVYSALNPAGATFPFAAGVISNLGIATLDEFHTFLASICTAQQLAAKDVLIVFGNSMLFQKQIALLPEAKVNEEMKSFAHGVPFDWVASKVYKTPTGNTLIAINRDFFDVLKQSMSTCTAQVIAVVPQFIFSQWLGKQTMNTKTLEALYAKSDALTDQTIIASRNGPKTFAQQEEYISKRYSGLLIVGFIFFLVAVFGVTFFVLRRQSQSVQKPATTKNIPIASASASPRSMVIATPAGKAAEAVQIVISHGTSQASTSSQLKNALGESGYTGVTQTVQSTVTVDKPFVLFTPSLSPSQRSQLTDIIRSVLKDVSIQESADIKSDVAITIGL